VPNIIKATHLELDALSQLFNNYRCFCKMVSDINAAKNFIQRRLDKQDSLIYIAIKNHKVIGFIQIYPSFSSVAMLPIWNINDLYVDAESRNQSVATKLLAHVKNQAKKLNIFNLQLATNIDNSQAQALYVKLGFQLNSQFKHYSLMVKPTN